MSNSKKLTYPHEYAAVLNGPDGEKPVIVGGQAVNLWAAVYLPQENSQRFGSVDLDILATPHVIRWMAEIPGWTYTPATDAKSVRQGQITTKTPDGRELHVEALGFVLGLDEQDMKAVVELKLRDIHYLTLDPVALLKSKCANINELAQGGHERHDEDHLKILGRCVPEYLREIAGEALAGRLGVEIVESTLRRLFKTMQTPADAGALWHAELSPDMLVPMECLRSPIPSISELCLKEIPAAKEAFKADNYRPKYRAQSSQAPMLTRSGRRKPRTTRHY